VRFRGRWVGKGAAFLVVVLALVALLSYVVMRLWNALIPELFHGPVLGFWQAAGLLVLSKILFGGLRGRHGPGHWHEHRSWHRERWREKLRTKWAAMTPEERERWRGKLQHRWCGWSPDEGQSSSSEPPKVQD
jgi:hypothetical protein